MSKAQVLENKLQEAGSDLFKLGKIIGEFQIHQSDGEIENAKQARDLIIRHIDQIKEEQCNQSEKLEKRTESLLDTLRRERDIQNECKRLFEDAMPKLKSLSNLFKCGLELHCSDFENEIAKRKRALEEGNLRIMITGEVCAGKSSILNMLMGGYYMPVGHGTCTVIPCEVQQSTKIRAVLHYTDSSTREIPLVTNEGHHIWLQLRECVETGEDKLQVTEERTIKQLKKVVLYWNFPFLNDIHQTHRKSTDDGETEPQDCDKVINGITIVDAPGIHDQELTFSRLHEYIEDCDAFLFVINTSQHAGIDRDRLVRLMNDVRAIFQRNNGIFTPRCALFVCNKWDCVDDAKRKDLQLEILNKLQACWSKVTDKQVMPFNGSMQVLKSVQQSDFSKEYVSFYERLCSMLKLQPMSRQRLTAGTSYLCYIRNPRKEALVY